MKNKCDVCEKEREMYFLPFPIFLSYDNMGIFCLDCGLSYLSQILGLNDEEIEDYLDFILK